MIGDLGLIASKRKISDDERIGDDEDSDNDIENSNKDKNGDSLNTSTKNSKENQLLY